MQRKGARRLQDIPEEIIAQLNLGIIESVNLMEWLVIDPSVLLKNILAASDRLHYLDEIKKNLATVPKLTINLTNQMIASTLLEQSIIHRDQELLKFLTQHRSDMVRGWACYVIALDTRLSLENRFSNIKYFAKDQHFGVREVAWLAMRQHIIDHLDESLVLLLPWTKDTDPCVRRYASEATRPRGVWCAHISRLKSQPQLASPLLDALSEDPTKYVKDSVANWLNDASKTQPEYVRVLCDRWQKKQNPHTNAIIKKAMRTLNKSI